MISKVSSTHRGWAPQRLRMFHAQLLVTWDRVLKVSSSLKEAAPLVGVSGVFLAT